MYSVGGIRLFYILMEIISQKVFFRFLYIFLFFKLFILIGG